MSKKITTEEFILRSNIIHSYKYDYSNTVYTKSSEKVSIKCKDHGVFEITPNNHLSGKGCKECGYKLSSKKQSLTKEEFILRANKVHNRRYIYDDVIYINGFSKILIKCKLHGIFEQEPLTHLKGVGCPKCNIKGISKEKFIEFSNNKECTFYIIKCFNENEEFYKIGITSRSIKDRFYGNNMPYKYEVIKEYKSSANDVWEIENYLKSNLRSCYTPKTIFGGSSGECFSDLKEIKNTLCYSSPLNVEPKELKYGASEGIDITKKWV